MMAPSTATEDARRLNRDAVQAMAQRQPQQARQLLNSALQLDPAFVPAWMNLAVAQRMDGDFLAALASVDAARKLDPLFFSAQLMRGSLLEEIGKPRQAAEAYALALSIKPPDDQLDQATQRAVAHAYTVYQRHQQALEDYLRRDVVTHAGGRTAPARRMNGFVEHMLGKRQIYHSDPTSLYYPGLPSIEVYDREPFPWLEDLEAATPQIQAELAGVFDDEVEVDSIEPYTQMPDGEPLGQWAELNHSRRWSAYHFSFYGRPYIEHRRKCPFTVGLLESLPQPHIPRRSPASMFSILQPRTHIPPHRGAANFRLLCHLPLILPEGCRLRVGGTIQHWRMNEAFIFDDTIEHEAWNDSDQMRTVMIFDLWHPALTLDERDFITRSLSALDQFNEQE